MKLVIDFWKKNKLWLGFLILLTILATTANLSFPYLLKMIVDGIQKNFSRERILQYVALLFLLGLGRSFLTTLLPFLRGRTNEKFGWLCRTEVFSAILKKGHKFLNQFPPGDVMERLDHDLNDLSWFSCSGIFRPIEGLLTLTIALIILIKINPLLTLLSLLPLASAALFWSKFGNLVHRTYQRWRERISAVCNYIESSLAGIKLLKAFLREKSTGEKFSPLLKERISRAVEFIKSEAKVGIVFRSNAEIAILIILLFGGIWVIKGKLTLGEFVAFMAYIVLLIQPFWDLGNFFVAYRRGKVAGKRIHELALFPEEIERKGEEKVSSLRGIIFDRVNFAYDGKMVLTDLNLTIKEGEKIGIAGPIGCGKTTIVKLILRLLEPTSGEIRVLTEKGILPLKELHLKSFRQFFGYCPQEASLFSETIRNNILFGREEYRENLEKVINLSGLKEEIKTLPEGIDSLIGERGIKLSGGQRERVAIARALLTSPQILILDDATASLDAEIEKRIVAHILKEVKSVIIISHRLSLLSLCDFVYVLSDGKIVEEGNPEELLNRKGLYWQLYERQLLKEELERDEKI
ncbi:MAG: ABC transporter ATP-binding protein [candidate division WOR-3 bacterium]